MRRRPCSVRLAHRTSSRRRRSSDAWSSKLVDGRNDIVALADTAIERRSEVESQGRETDRRQVTEHGVDDRIESIASVLRVRVAHHDAAGRVPVRCGNIRVSSWPSLVQSSTDSIRRTVPSPPVSAGDQKIPIKMLNDRLLVKLSKEDGERTSTGGILIPATAQMAKRLVWAEVVALGPERAQCRDRRPGPVQPRRTLRGRSRRRRLHHAARTRSARRGRATHRGEHRAVPVAVRWRWSTSERTRHTQSNQVGVAVRRP